MNNAGNQTILPNEITSTSSPIDELRMLMQESESIFGVEHSLQQVERKLKEVDISKQIRLEENQRRPPVMDHTV